MSFEQLPLSKELVAALAAAGMVRPTPIQQKMIPPALAGSDVLAEAPTGTGKTLAFGLPLLMKADPKEPAPGALVLAPTRELAGQIAGELQKFSSVTGVQIVRLCGGEGMGRQLERLERGAQIAVGTPGRVLDHFRRRSLDPARLSLVVLDEADELLDMGFAPEVKEILHAVPKGRQTLMTSATLSGEVEKLSGLCQRNPVRIRADLGGERLPPVRTFAVMLREKQKFGALKALLKEEDLRRSLVFCNTRARAEALFGRLDREGFLVLLLHGDLPQRGRERALEAFRRGEANLLVASDVAARGLDLPEVEAVFNYDFPLDEESYVHRIGRTARAEREGLAFSFVCPQEISRMRRCELWTRRPMEERVIPGLSAAPGRKAAAEGALRFRIEGLPFSEGEALRWLRREAGIPADGVIGLCRQGETLWAEAVADAEESLLALDGREAEGKVLRISRTEEPMPERPPRTKGGQSSAGGGAGKERRPAGNPRPVRRKPGEWYPYGRKPKRPRGKR